MTDGPIDTLAPEVETATGLLGRLGRSKALLFLAWFALILILKWPTLTQPPVWDGSMGVFPASIVLAENNFDVGDLLDQPSYADGGPNVHSLSLVTWFTAAVVALLGDSAALFPVLHLIHFAIAAAAMTGIYLFAVPLLGSGLAAAASLAGLTFPIVLTQAGYLYLEFPMLAATVFALSAWARNNAIKAMMWASLAVLIKGSGIAIAGTLAAMAFFDPRKDKRDFRSGLIMLLPPVAIIATSISQTPGIERTGDFSDHLRLMITYLALVPDLLGLLGLYLLLTVFLPPWRRRLSSRAEPAEQDAAGRSISIAFLTLAFFGIYLFLPLVGVSLSVLPRYYVQIAPFVIIGLAASLRQRLPQLVVLSALILMTGWFSLNRNGDFYPRNTANNFALIERSGAYTDLLELQRIGTQAIVDLPSDVAVFYDQPTHYKLEYPLMGYATGELANGHSIRHEAPFRNGHLEDFPSEFYLLYEHPWLGGETIRSVWEQAASDPNREVAVEDICSAAFCSKLIHVTSATVP